MMYVIIFIITLFEIAYVVVNSPVYANVPPVALYLIPLIIIMVVVCCLMKFRPRMSKVVRRSILTVEIIGLLIVPTAYVRDVPLYTYGEAREIISQREKVFPEQFSKRKLLELPHREDGQYLYVLKVNTGQDAIYYEFNPYNGGYHQRIEE
ncbi:hypothetical protein [Priestia koreensis]|uniref:hypothetical protein n=1 Tax=Priestia koreensis TaxID=284581 RepID=UPI001F5629AD|nr:hypothetical protein [Priestia koreensis]UNL83032.1 hypothetical protein IE339_12580 [Priestia koreensis]